METIAVPKMSTRVKLYGGPPSQGGAQLLAFAQLVISDAFVIKDIRVVKAKPKDGGEEYTFVAFPQRKGKEDYVDVAHPITADAYRAARDMILAAYEEAASADPKPS